jgi:hypothetical protein
MHSKRFEIKDTVDLAAIYWTKDDGSIIVQDTSLEFRIQIYSLDGRLLSDFHPYKFKLGAKTLAVSPSSYLIAVGGYDQKVAFLIDRRSFFFFTPD